MLPDIPAVAEDVHENLAPLGIELSVTAVVWFPEHMVCEAIAFKAGLGLRVTTKVDVAPMQLLSVGVIVYITVPVKVSVVLNIWEGIFPVPPAMLPVMPVVAEDAHIKPAPEGVEARVTAVVEPPEHTV